MTPTNTSTGNSAATIKSIEEIPTTF
jgi:hypothetical protein